MQASGTLTVSNVAPSVSETTGDATIDGLIEALDGPLHLRIDGKPPPPLWDDIADLREQIAEVYPTLMAFTLEGRLEEDTFAGRRMTSARST